MNILWYNWLLFIFDNLKLHQWIIVKPHHQTLNTGPVKGVLPPPFPPLPLPFPFKWNVRPLRFLWGHWWMVMIGMWAVVLQATRTSCLSIKNKTVSVSTGTFQVSKMRWYYNTAIMSHTQSDVTELVSEINWSSWRYLYLGGLSNGTIGMVTCFVKIWG